ncbi:hypothetical protein MBLNU459_g7031t1 [Dothideomycetes sp. NU459]
MPLMVDDHSIMDDMDDLFGDGDGDGNTDALNTGLTDGLAEGLTALAAALDSDALLQRVEHSHMIGCCQKLAWSKTGSIASISPDGRTITTRAVARSPNTGKWALSDDSPQPIIAQGDTIFTHIEWSTFGLELVATDQLGRIFIFSMGYALNRMIPTPLNYSPAPDDLNVIVGLHWLAPNTSSQRIALISPATREGNRWSNAMKLVETAGVSHPFDNRAAFLCVTRSNSVKLIYQQPNQRWTETETELGILASSGDVITHAAFGDASNHLLLVTYDTSKSLRLYRLGIGWNPSGGDALHPPSVNPQLNLKHVHILDRCMPQSHGRPFSEGAPNMMHTSPIGAELSSIQIKPPMSATDGPFMVMAVFTSSGSDDQLSQHSAGKFSVIARWELQQTESTLHESFKSLKPGTENPVAGSKTVNSLRRLEDTMTSKIVLSTSSNFYNSIFAFAASDGTVEFRQRETMDVIVADGDGTRASSLAQNGFTFMPMECVDIALSPGGCMAAVARPDGTVQLHTADYLHGWTGAKADDALAQAAIVSLVRVVGILICHQIGTDDVLAMIPTDLEQAFRHKFISELFRTVSRNTDYSQDEASKQSGKVMKDSILFKILGLQLVLGYKDNPAQRDISAKMAWVMLNLRVVCTSVAQSMSTNTPQTPDVYISLRGLIRWSVDLMTQILDDLFNIMRTCRNQPMTRDLIQETVMKLNTPSLHLLLHSAPRALIRLVTEILKPYLMKVNHARTKNLVNTISERAALEDIEALLTTRLPFRNLKVIETLIAEIDGTVRKAYADAHATAQLRSHAEQALLVESVIPGPFEPVLRHVFGAVLPKLLEAVDGAGVFFAETGWLGLKDGKTKEANIDAVRKMEIPRGAKVRMCRRCGSLTEDAWDGAPPWIQAGHKMCVCLSHWLIV